MRKNKSKIIVDLSVENTELRKQTAEMSSYISLLEKLFVALYKKSYPQNNLTNKRKGVKINKKK